MHLSLPKFNFTHRKDKWASYSFTTKKIDTQYVSGFLSSQAYIDNVNILHLSSVFKYKKDTDASLGDKLSKLSLHSIKKKSSRIRERFSVNLGFIDQTRDENFDKEETRYRSLEKVVRVFVKDVQMYIDQVTVSF